MNGRTLGQLLVSRQGAGFLLLAAVSLAGVLGIAAVRLDSLQRKMLESRLKERVTTLCRFEAACRAFAKNDLSSADVIRPYPLIHHDEMFATLVTRDIFQNFNSGPLKHAYKCAIPNARTSANRADPFESDIIACLRAAPDLKELTGHRTISGQDVGYVARPIRVDETCLACHGNVSHEQSASSNRNSLPHNHDWHEREIAGATIFYIPLADLHAEYASMRWMILSILAVLALSLLTLSYLLFAKLIGRTEELKKAREQAEASTKAKSQFLANMSHEIRTPMTAILGFVECLVNDDLPACERHNAADVIRRNGEHLLNVINDILDISKIEAGQMTVDRVSCSLLQVVDDVEAVMRARLVKGLEFIVEYVGPIPAMIYSAPTRLRQILLNVVNNAVKFTERGNVRLVCQYIGGKKPIMQFDVIDTGIGMTSEQMERVLQPFVQADNSTARTYGGTGLGLTLSEHLAKLLGGNLTIVHSQTGVGTQVRVRVAAEAIAGATMLNAISPKTPPAQEQPVEDTNRKPHPRDRILLAEDGPDNQRLIEYLLRKAGAEVVVVENGRLAVDAVLANKPDDRRFTTILMDMQMPVMDGYEATTLLRQKGYTGPIIALTAHAMAEDRQKCIDAGCDDYLAKPIDRVKLLESIRRCSDQYQETTEVANAVSY